MGYTKRDQTRRKKPATRLADTMLQLERLDLSCIDGIQRKRLLTFINGFGLRTADFLNKFASDVEVKIAQLELRLKKLETSLIMLETQLDSVPSLREKTVVARKSECTNENTSVSSIESRCNSASTAAESGATAFRSLPVPPPPPPPPPLPPPPPPTFISDSIHVRDSHLASSPAASSKCQEQLLSAGHAVSSARNDPKYAPFFKMVAVGVPPAAVRLKMRSLGLNEEILDT